ncbi:MAG: HEAT repeat domain-containing protein [Acidobacteriota bacterium]
MRWFSTADLLTALRDEELDVCYSAAEQARTQSIRDAVPALVELLYRSGPGSKRVITAAAQALGDIGDLRAIQHLGEAAYAHEYDGPVSGSITITTHGNTIEPDNQDVLMDEALREAEQKLWKQPGAEPYLSQLGRIRMYTFGDFLRTGEIFIDPDIQKQPLYPFTMDCAQRFFSNFKKERFAFEGAEIKSIFIRRGKEALPRHSFAGGRLYPQTLDEIGQLGESALDPVGEIDFEFGGNATAPYIQVSPQPNWPRPSIVRRCVLDGRSGIRFDEIT